MIFGAALLSIAAATAGAYNKIPWSDEGQFSSASYNLARHGFLGTTVVDSVNFSLPGIERHTYWVMPLYLAGQAAWLKIFPATIVSVRMFTIVWIPVALVSFYLFIRRVSGNARAAALATCLFSLSYIFLDNAGFARPDVMCCALGLAGLAAYVEWRELHFYRALLLSNALVAASGLTHPNGVFHLLGLIVVVVYYDRQRLNVSALAAAAVPYAVFGAAWAWYIFQDYPAFAAQMRTNGTNGRWTATLNPLVIVWNEIRMRYMVAFGLVTRGWSLLKLPALIAYMAAIGAALFQRDFRSQPSTRLLALLAATYFAGLAVFNQKLGFYLVHILPWYVGLLALYVDWLWRRRPALRPALAIAMVALVGLETGGILLKARMRSPAIADESAAIDFARAHAGPRDRIVGSAALIYGFDFDPRLRDDTRLGTTSGRIPDLIIVEPIYRDVFDGWKALHMPEAAPVAERLGSYRLAYERGVSQVYLRQDH
jgi:hypothetical protein